MCGSIVKNLDRSQKTIAKKSIGWERNRLDWLKFDRGAIKIYSIYLIYLFLISNLRKSTQFVSKCVYVWVGVSFPAYSRCGLIRSDMVCDIKTSRLLWLSQWLRKLPATAEHTDSRGEQTQLGLPLLAGLGPLLNWGTALAGEIQSLSGTQAASRRNSMKWLETAKQENAQISLSGLCDLVLGVCDWFKGFQVLSSSVFLAT